MSQVNNQGSYTVPKFLDIKKMLLEVGTVDPQNGNYSFPNQPFIHDGKETYVYVDHGYDRNQEPNPDGYRRIWVRHGNLESIMIYEHILVAEMIMQQGTRLPKYLDTHHVRGNKHDNRPSELRLVKRPRHKRIHERTHMDDKEDQLKCERHQAIGAKIEPSLELRTEASEYYRRLCGQSDHQILTRFSDNRPTYEKIKLLKQDTRLRRFVNGLAIKRLEKQL